MTAILTPDNTLSRRAWLILTGTTLVGCGGGGLGDLVAVVTPPGVGGTGAVYSQGTISGFGSVVVNAVKYDDSAATVRINGQVATPQDLRLGMVATVNGTRAGIDPLTGAALGRASDIAVWSIAQGPIQGLNYAGTTVTSVQLMGMHILLDGNTNLDSTPLAVNQNVVIWGLVVNDAATQWRATRVQVQPGGTTLRMSTGRVQRSGAQVMLNGVTLSGQAVTDLLDGQLVRVQGTQTDSPVMTVAQVWLLETGLNTPTPSGSDVEIEGFVTRTPVAGQFKIGNINVNASLATLATTLGTLYLGARLEVCGRWAENTLIATQIELKSQLSDDGQEGEIKDKVEIEGRIEQFTSAADFVMRGQRCNAAQATFTHGAPSDLPAAYLNQTSIKVEGHYEGAILVVEALEFEQD
jgi:hypothetical protein